MRSAILFWSILSGAAISAQGAFTLDSLLPPPDAIRDLPPAIAAPLHSPTEVLAALLAQDSEAVWSSARPYTMEAAPPPEAPPLPGSPDYAGPMLGFLEFQDILPPDDFDIVTDAEELAVLLYGRAPPPEIPPPPPLPDPAFLAQDWRVPCPAYAPAPVAARDLPTDPKAPPVVVPPPTPPPAAAPPKAPRAVAPTTYLVDQPTTSMLAARSLVLCLSSRLGRLRSGPDDFWGLDDPATRIGVDYGATDRLTLGLGRSSTGKSIDAHGKILLLREDGDASWPMAAAFDASFAYSLAPSEGRRETPGERTAWLASLLLSHPFGRNATVQIAPGLAHVGRSAREGEPATWGIVATLVRLRLSPGLHLGAEAAVPVNGLSLGNDAPGRGPGLSAAIELATDGGAFVLHVGNCRGQTTLDAVQFNVPATDIGVGLNYVHGWRW